MGASAALTRTRTVHECVGAVVETLYVRYLIYACIHGEGRREGPHPGTSEPLTNRQMYHNGAKMRDASQTAVTVSSPSPMPLFEKLLRTPSLRAVAAATEVLRFLWS